MKCSIAGLLLLAFVAVVGCNSGTRGGPGATNTDASKPLYGLPDNTFNLSVPAMSTTIKQGETKKTSIGINRGTNFDENVTLTFASMPTGVTLNPSHSQITRGETEAHFVLTAAVDASLGDFKVKVTGHPSDGADATNDLRITVAKN